MCLMLQSETPPGFTMPKLDTIEEVYGSVDGGANTEEASSQVGTGKQGNGNR